MGFNKPTVQVLVGLPASGKTQYAKGYSHIKVFSSDELREELYGNAAIQGNHVELFDILHKRIIEHLQSGKDVIFDATNINYKHRMAFIQKVKSVIDVNFRCVVFVVPVEVCIERDLKRERTVSESVIRRMHKQFYFPCYWEGWDIIDTILMDTYKDYYGNYHNIMQRANEMPHDNPHHSLSVGDHMSKCAWLAIDGGYLDDMIAAAQLHDIGKLDTKVFTDARGSASEIAHYYGHDSVGAYNAMFILHNFEELCDPIYVCGLIQWHMRPYLWGKKENKYRELWGEEFYEMLMILNKFDMEAH